MDIDPAKIYLRPPQFYEDINVEIRKNKEATSLDTDSQVVTFSDGDKIEYDKLLIATGIIVILVCFVALQKIILVVLGTY